MESAKAGFDLTHALEEVAVAAAVIDRDGLIRWLNRGAIAAVGERVGEPFARAIAPEDVELVRRQFAKKVDGEQSATDYTATLLLRDGGRQLVRISSVPLLRDGEIIGTFGLAYPAGTPSDGPAAPQRDSTGPELTARQYETLALLADGLGTSEIASRLGVADETARNHIRALLGQLGAHSRLEAVVRAYRLGLLEPRRDD